MPSLLTLVRRHADTHADRFGHAQTPFRGLGVVRQYRSRRIAGGGAKASHRDLSSGSQTGDDGHGQLRDGAGEALVITADVPTISEITEASPVAPYYALALELDPALLRELAVTADLRAGNTAPVRIEPADPDVTDAALRLMRLLERPDAQPVLGEALLREMHYWLLTGRHGAAIRALGAVDSHAHRIARAVALIRRDYAHALRITDLAEVAGMSESTFHQHFRAITTLSPFISRSTCD